MREVTKTVEERVESATAGQDALDAYAAELVKDWPALPPRQVRDLRDLLYPCRPVTR